MDDQTTSLELSVQKLTPGQLVTNAKAIAEAVKLRLEDYKAENYSEANIQDAKKSKAELNAAAKKLNDRRIELEREFMKPFDEFKAIVTETCELIRTASTQIDVIVKEVEEREKREKQEKIEAFFATTGCTLFTIDRIFDKTWLNKGTKMKDVEARIRERIAGVEADLSVLDKIGEPEARAFYLTTLDLHRAIQQANDIKANRERLAAAERARAEVALGPVDEEPVPQADPPKPRGQTAEELLGMDDEPEPTPAPPVSEPVFEFTIRFRGTRSKLAALREYIDANGIEYEKL